MRTTIVSFICPGEVVDKVESAAMVAGLTRSMAIRRLLENLDRDEIVKIISKKGESNANSQ